MPSRASAARAARVPRSAAARLAEAERLYQDFVALTPYRRPKPFVKSFDSFEAYEAWRRAQRNPWLR
jgi:hypothetical protein